MTHPTRVTGRTATLIDIILISSYDNKCTSVNITTSVSDHLPQFRIMGISKGKTNMIKNPKAFYFKKNLVADHFKAILKKQL